ncbi:hypothetical protein GIY62_35450 (plasmid) [Burkholderia plantarii]|uniref:plasmid mobilization protein n=1 Tax=Burkholderia plantarii TaxID=41899 RepID=UPI00272CAADF|nr:hypothetical protein [Burkholderia plantarii]WLE64157.1 hypothetical protein GIY62_35450 [Burkholderia plantarii]
MPRSSGTSKGKSFPLTIRFNRDENQHYRSKANEAGLSASEYCRQKLARGQLGDGIAQLENRLTALITAVQQIAAQLASMQVPAPASPGAERGQSSGTRLNKVQLAHLEAVFTAAEILSVIAHDKSPQVRDRAQDVARAKIRELTGGGNG